VLEAVREAGDHIGPSPRGRPRPAPVGASHIPPARRTPMAGARPRGDRTRWLSAVASRSHRQRQPRIAATSPTFRRWAWSVPRSHRE
jgi:hypothetical protein